MSSGQKYTGNRFWFFLVPIGLFLWFGLVVFRLFDLHIGGRDCHNQTTFKKPIPAVRGVIYDSIGSPVAVNQPGYEVFIDPKSPVKEGQDKAATARRISELTGRNYNDVYKDIIGEGGKGRYIKQGVTFDESAMDLLTNKTLYCCAGVEPITLRRYPQGKFFSHVVGYVSGADQVGRNGGVEQYAEEYLRGTPGFIEGSKDRNGQEIRERRKTTVTAKNGAAVHLTIDHNIQHVVCSALEYGITNFNAVGGKVIIQKVQTGEILAMASYPNFDPSNWRKYSGNSLRNATIGRLYEPGSTMKAVTVAAAMNERLIDPGTVFDIGNGSWNYGGHVLHDHPKGRVTVSQIIQKSSNIGAAMIALKLGNARLERYIKAFGITQKTDIDLPGEEKGLLPPSSTWEPVKPTRVAMGQGISVTPLQMLNAYNTIANGGHRMRPYVISRVEAPDGEVLMRNEPREVGRPIRPETAAAMRKMLQSVTFYSKEHSERGTGWKAAIDGYSVAGKTGTAQMIVDGEYSKRDYWSSFVGFVPAENPVFSMIVILDRPRGEIKNGIRGAHDGGGTAAPVFSLIAQYVAQYLEIPLYEESAESQKEK